ncbi:MAG: hypothetical protein A3E78_13425 [Alphaproteobacteria bacterium RIFCSPHIGHO2_12_FULL_63_12]|nr:MAG: hypothetical protein A3E78_13425 [Alphaproteobacteria bacterium RIFCSPHIGHO2_12_FULL_63_12]
MIKYQLKCGSGCSFEGWFRSSEDFDSQAAKGALECPFCASTQIGRAIMAPAVVAGGGARRNERLEVMRETMAAAARRARDYVEKNFDYVGEKFPEEARKIHYGETRERSIYGEATGKEVKDLVDEGVSVAPMPAPAIPGDVAKKKLN